MARLRRQEDPRWTAALEYWHDAQNHLQAAEAARRGCVGSEPIPAFFLYGRTLELGFKAFLLSRGETTTRLATRQFGHNLSALYREARRRHLGREVRLGRIEAEAIERLSESYARKRLEYRQAGPLILPLMPPIASGARRLVGGVRGACVRRLFPERPAGFESRASPRQR